jgi:parallel beta-helix repeat protein
MLSIAEKIKLIILCLILSLFLCNDAKAATVSWTGAGTDNLASNKYNWSGNTLPQYGDDVVFNATSSKDCDWDFDVVPVSLSINFGYSGKITINSGINLTVENNLVSPDAPTGLNAVAVSSSQINLSWTCNSNKEAGFIIERKTGFDGLYGQIADIEANETSYPDTGLSAGTAYYYKVKAHNFVGDSAYSNEANAITVALLPTATTNAASYVNGNAATLNATVNPNGSETTVYFEYGTSISYGSRTNDQSIGSGTNGVSVSDFIDRLSTNTIYHFRIVAANTGGTIYGDDVSFTTNGGTTKSGATISSSTTWTYAGSPYIITGNILVYFSASEPVLTIEPGVEVRFNGNCYLKIGNTLTSKGRLVAQGTSDRPIIFTSNTTPPTAGDWGGIRFYYHASAESILEHVKVEYGSYSTYGEIYLSNSSPTIRNSTISNSSNDGIYMAGDSAPVITDSTISDNGGEGIFVSGTAASVSNITNTTFSNNGSYDLNIPVTSTLGSGNVYLNSNGIKLTGTTISADTTWLYQTAPYIITGNVSVYNAPPEPTLTIEPGVEVRFNGNYYLRIGYSQTSTGRLVAQGTPSSPIIFTSGITPPAVGNWNGIRFFSHASTESILEHVTVEYAGSAILYGEIYFNDNSPAISNSTIRHSAYDGIYIVGDSVPVITGSTMSDNGRYGVYSSGTGNVDITFSTISNNVNYAAYSTNSVLKINHCNITGNGNGVYVPSGKTADALYNWWGDIIGPGASVSAGVAYEPWLGAPYTYPFYNSALSATLQQFNAPDSSADYTFTISDNSTWNFYIKDSVGTTVKTFTGSGTTGAVTWDGRNEIGAVVPTGTHTYQLSSTSLIDSAQSAPLMGDVIVNNVLPNAEITYPLDNQFINNILLNIQGTASDTDFNNYIVEYGAGTEPAAWTLITSSTTPVTAGTLATWNPSSLTDPYYKIRLTANDNALHTATTSVGIKLLNIYSLNVSNSSFSPNGDGIKDTTTITASITYPSNWALDIKNAGGTTVKTFIGTGNSISVIWNGTNTSGVIQPEGDYSLIITATEPTSGTIAAVTGNVIIDLPASPIAITESATNVAADSATLNASVNPNEAVTAAYFKWGTGVSYGNQTDEQTIGYGTSAVPVTANLSTLSQGTAYHYQIVASSIAGTTYGNDMSFTTILPAPSNLTATTISASQIDLSWADNSNNETGFEIERKTGTGGTYSLIDTVGADTTAYSDTGLLPGTTYYYRIKAYTDDADSSYSNEINDTTIALAPTAITDPATNINGNSASLNARVNPNGAATTVYFEYGTSTSYGDTTDIQSIGSGTDNITVSANITGLSVNTTYHYRVVAENGIDTTNGDDMTFTTPPITLTITSPLNGDTINRPDVMVKGTMANTTGNETGVTVNGTVAIIYGNQFIANHVPLTEGSNTITVTATDTASYTATTSIQVNTVTTGNYIKLTANIESGTSPLETTLSIDGSFSITNSNMSVSGPGSVEWLSTSVDEYRARMTTEGIYYFTASVTKNSIVYQDTVAIVVLSSTELDNLLRSKWNAMTNSLSIQDTTTALTFIASGSRPSYEEMFNALYEQLPAITATQQEFHLHHITGNIAKYKLVTFENDKYYSYEVTFIKDENGIWMILQY